MSDVDKLAQATKKSFDKVDKQFIEVKQEIKASENRINKRIDQSQKEILHEFKALAENIHQDVAGANQDKISFIAQKQDVLEKRMIKVEHKIGV